MPGEAPDYDPDARTSGRHQDVEQFGAGSRPKGVESLTEYSLEFRGIHEGER